MEISKKRRRRDNAIFILKGKAHGQKSFPCHYLEAYNKATDQYVCFEVVPFKPVTKQPEAVRVKVGAETFAVKSIPVATTSTVDKSDIQIVEESQAPKVPAATGVVIEAVAQPEVMSLRLLTVVLARILLLRLRTWDYGPQP